MNMKHQKKLNMIFLRFKMQNIQFDGPLIKIRHIVVTDNYLAAEEIQNENWQYFIQRTI